MYGKSSIPAWPIDQVDSPDYSKYDEEGKISQAKKSKRENDIWPGKKSPGCTPKIHNQDSLS
jgi:hypothetical protein